MNFLEFAQFFLVNIIKQEIEGIGDATKVFWENQVVMKKNFENFTQFGDSKLKCYKIIQSKMYSRFMH